MLQQQRENLTSLLCVVAVHSFFEPNFPREIIMKCEYKTVYA